jgi:SMI1 / KNR4 family (SUKH-1)
MHRDLTTLIQEYGDPAPGASPEAFSEVEQYFGIKFPTVYRQFMLRSNGAEGLIGESYVVLYPIEELVDINTGYGTSVVTPGMLLFGGDGGGEAYAFDIRKSAMPIIMVTWVSLDFEEALPAGDSFTAFLEALYAGRTFFEERSVWHRIPWLTS